MRYTTARTPGGMTVDYADVLRQAVENERFRVLREVHAVLDNEPLAHHQYRDEPTNSSARFRNSVKRKIQTLEEN